MSDKTLREAAHHLIKVSEDIELPLGPAIDRVRAALADNADADKPDCCSICAGTRKTLTDEPCICKTGTIYGELDALRREVLDSADAPEAKQFPCGGDLDEIIKQTDAPEGPCNTVYLVFVDEVEWSEVVGVFSSSEAAAECKDWVAAQLVQEPINCLDSKVHVKAWVVDGSTRRGTWRAWIDLNGEASGDPHYDCSRNVIESYQMKRNDKPCGWAATGETVDDAYARARDVLNRLDVQQETGANL